jgi:O-antigen ligase
VISRETLASRVAVAAGIVSFTAVVLLSFLFGGAERDTWEKTVSVWLFALATSLIAMRSAPRQAPAHGVFLGLHALCAIQLIPLPTAVLRVVSPGAFFAHTTANPAGDSGYPLTVSRLATLDAWYWILGLHALYWTSSRWFGLRPGHREKAVFAFGAVAAALSTIALVQSKSVEPDWPYGWVPIENAQEKGITGPFFNRNAFAAVVAPGATLALATAISALRRGPTGWPAFLAGLSTAALTLAAVGVSGSRAGLISLVVGFGAAAIAGRARSVKAILLIAGSLGLALLGTGLPLVARRLGSLDLEASRLSAWLDMTRLWPHFKWTGHGVGAFGEAYRPYQTVFTYEFWPHAHNDYLEFALEAGLAGALVSLIAVARTILHLRRSAVLPAAVAGFAPLFALAAMDFPVRLPAAAALAVVLLAALPGEPASTPDQ